MNFIECWPFLIGDLLTQRIGWKTTFQTLINVRKWPKNGSTRQCDVATKYQIKSNQTQQQQQQQQQQRATTMKNKRISNYQRRLEQSRESWPTIWRCRIYWPLSFWATSATLTQQEGRRRRRHHHHTCTHTHTHRALHTDTLTHWHTRRAALVLLSTGTTATALEGNSWHLALFKLFRYSTFVWLLSAVCSVAQFLIDCISQSQLLYFRFDMCCISMCSVRCQVYWLFHCIWNWAV